MPFAHWMVWLALFLLFAVVELCTVQLVSIWFAVGALAGGVAALVTHDQSLVAEIVSFVAVTAITLALTKPLVKKLKSGADTPTNKDTYIGQQVLVTKEVRTDTGSVIMNDVDWDARLENPDSPSIPAGAKAEIVRIEGNKLIVKPV